MHENHVTGLKPNDSCTSSRTAESITYTPSSESFSDSKQFALNVDLWWQCLLWCWVICTRKRLNLKLLQHLRKSSSLTILRKRNVRTSDCSATPLLLPALVHGSGPTVSVITHSAMLRTGCNSTGEMVWLAFTGPTELYNILLYPGDGRGRQREHTAGTWNNEH